MDKYNFNSNDIMTRFLFDNHGIRGEIIKIKESGEKLIHKEYPDVLKSLMLELAVSAEMFAATLKDGSEIMMQLQGGKNADLKYAIINVRADLSFYGSAKLKNENTESSNFNELVGNDGLLVLSVFPKNGTKWQGIIDTNGSSVSDVLENYFKKSQQLPSRFFIYSDPKTCTSAAIMLQIIPEIENNLDSLEHLSVLTETLSSEEIFELPQNEVLNRLYAHEQTRVFEPKTIEFKCICSKERCQKALESLSFPDLQELANDEVGTEMTCQHCGKKYNFTKEDLQNILVKAHQ